MFFAKKTTVTQVGQGPFRTSEVNIPRPPSAFVRFMRGIWSRRGLFYLTILALAVGAVQFVRYYILENTVLVRVDRVMWTCHDFTRIDRNYRTVSTSGNALPVRCPPLHQTILGNETQTVTQEMGRVIATDAHLRFRGRAYTFPIWDDERRTTPVRVVPGECVELSVYRSGRVTNDWVERSRPCR